MADDDFNAVLSGVKDAAQEQNAPNSTPPKDDTTAPAPEAGAPIAPELKGVLDQVKTDAHPVADQPPMPRSTDELDKEIADHQKQQKAYDDYQQSQQPSEIGKVASGLLPGNPFAASSDKLKQANDFFKDSVTGRIADAMGHAVIEDVAQGTEELLHPVSSHGVTKKEEDEFPIHGESMWQNSMNQVVRAGIATGGIAYSLQDALMSLASTPFSAGAAGLQTAAKESGSETAMNEAAFITQPEILGVLGGHGIHAEANLAGGAQYLRDFVSKPPLPMEVAKAVNNGILEPSDPTIKAEAAQTVGATDALAARTQRLEAQKGLVSAEVTPGIHDIVRQDNPELFNNYDRLTAQREQARSTIHDPEIAGKEYDDKLAGLKQQRADNLSLPTDLPKEEMDAAVKKSQERDADIAAQIKELGARNKYIADSKSDAQQRFQELDNQLRDITPDVSRAYADAAPKAREAAFAPAEAKPFTDTSAAAEATPEAPKAEPAGPAFDIAADVKKKLSSEGRTKEQAEAESQIIAARYETAAANGWAKGTAGEIYQRHMAEIKDARTAKSKAKAKASELAQSDRGNIALASRNSGKAIIKLFKNSDASTLMHEMAHHWLDEMVSWEKEPGAPEDLKSHMDAVRTWLGKDTGEFSGFTDLQHEKWARGFESYLREGVAPSAKLANAFAHFKTWLSKIYTTMDKLKVDISPEVRNVFDHMLAQKPERISIAPEHEAGKALAAVHETDARLTPPEQADSVRDTVAKEVDNTAKLHDPEVADGIKNAEQTGGVAAATPSSTADGATTGQLPGEGGVAEESGKIPAGGSDAGAESTGPRAEPDAAAGRPDTTERGPAAGDEKPIRSKPASALVDKAGNLVVSKLDTSQEISSALHLIADKTSYLDHDVISDVEVGAMAIELGDKNTDSVLSKLQSLSDESGIPLAAYIRAARIMLRDATNEVRAFAAKVKGGTDADFMNAMIAKDRFMLIATTLSKATNEIGRAMRSFHDLKGTDAVQMQELLQQGGTSREEMETLFQVIASKDTDELRDQVPKILQKAAKPGPWDIGAAWSRCAILSNFITHTLWLGGTAVNTLAFKPLVLDTLGGIDNHIGMLLGKEDTGSRVWGGVAGLYHTIANALPSILSKVGTSIAERKTVLRPGEAEFDENMGVGMRKVLGLDKDELEKAVKAAFDKNDNPDIKALQDKVDAATASGDTVRAKVLQDQLNKVSQDHVRELTETIAARMSSRLKSWAEVTEELHHFGAAAAASITSGLKSRMSGDFYKDKAAVSTSRPDGNVIPDINVKGLNVLPIGSIMHGSSNVIYSTMHTLAREVAANVETVQVARRIAVQENNSAAKEGRPIRDVTTRMGELMSDPTPEMLSQVNESANRQTLMSNSGELAKILTGARSKFDAKTGTKIGATLFPVLSVPLEALHQTWVDASPLGLISSVMRDKLTNGQGSIVGEHARAEMIAGTALLAFGAWQYSLGNVTPSESVNYSEEEQRKEAGRASNSIRIGDWMVSVTHTAKIGSLLTAGADMAHILAVYRGQDLSDKIRPAIQSAVANAFLRENPLASGADMINAMRGLTGIEAYAKNFVVSRTIPQFIKATDDLLDPQVRESKSFMSALLSKIPGESDTLAPKVSALTGEPLVKSPMRVNSANGDVIAQKLSDIHIYPANPIPVINKVNLTPQQASEYSSIKGHIIHSGMQMLMQGEGQQDFDAADVDGKRKMAVKIETHASQCAKSYMFNKYPEILQDANNKYEQSCVGEMQ